MSMLIKNLLFAGKTVAISSENVQFNGEGVGEVQSDELAYSVLKLKGFERVEDEPVVVTEVSASEVSTPEAKSEIPPEVKPEVVAPVVRQPAAIKRTPPPSRNK